MATSQTLVSCQNMLRRLSASVYTGLDICHLVHPPPNPGQMWLSHFTDKETSFKTSKAIFYIVGILVWAALTNYHRLSGLNNKHLFLIILGARSPGSGCQHRWVLGDDPLPDLQMVVFLLCLHTAESREQSKLSLVSSFKSTNSIRSVSPS